MKKSIILIAIVSCFFALQTAKAQNPITTLEHAGTTTVFAGQNSLVDAYNASVNGDALYLSTGFFTAPVAIAKGIKIIGAGHFPDSANVAKRTTILSGLTINAGADSLRLEGMYISGDINYAGGSSINYVKVIRCRFNYARFNSNSVTASKNYCSFEECFIEGIYFSGYGTNLNLLHNLISYSINSISGALIDGNVFLYNYYALQSVASSLIKNNIFLWKDNVNVQLSCTGNIINNNVFVGSPDLGTNSVTYLYNGVAQANIFLNQTGNLIDYTHNYHLKDPSKYIGTDGTQVGLYGGSTPFKEKGVPSNPQVATKNIATQTDAKGNLQINFTVKAQDR